MNALLDGLAIKLPSWAFGNSGTRFKMFGTLGTARTAACRSMDVFDADDPRFVEPGDVPHRIHGWSVVAGPVEATAIGNVLIQARAHGVLSGDLDQLRGTMATALPTEWFTPQRTPAERSLT